MFIKKSTWLPLGYPTTLATCIKKYADLKKNSYSFTLTHFLNLI